MSALKLSSQNHAQVQVLQSLVVTLLSLAPKVAEAWEFRRVLFRAASLRARPDASEYSKILIAKTCQKGIFIYVGYFVLLLSVAYGVCTCLMAHHCKQGMWGIRGCMNVHT